MAPRQLHVGTRELLAADIVHRIEMAAQAAIVARGVFTLAIPGGSVADVCLPLLADAEVSWEKCHLFWCDERAVPIDDVNSNAGQALRLTRGTRFATDAHWHVMYGGDGSRSSPTSASTTSQTSASTVATSNGSATLPTDSPAFASTNAASSAPRSAPTSALRPAATSAATSAARSASTSAPSTSTAVPDSVASSAPTSLQMVSAGREIGSADNDSELVRSLRMAADRYTQELAAVTGTPIAIDFALLGVGEDGHIASLFPNHASAMDVASAVITIADSPKPPPGRLSLSFGVLVRSREVIVAAFGAGKANAMQQALENSTSATPVARIIQQNANVHVMLDPDAASLLRSSR